MMIVSEAATVYRVVGLSGQFTSLDKAIEASIVRRLTALGWGATAAIKVAECRGEVWRILDEHITLQDKLEDGEGSTVTGGATE
jgi:hypothetical protein